MGMATGLRSDWPDDSISAQMTRLRDENRRLEAEVQDIEVKLAGEKPLTALQHLLDKGGARVVIGGVWAVLTEVYGEYLRAQVKWGGHEHDDTHGLADWTREISNRADAVRLARVEPEEQERNRKLLIEIANLAVTAVGSIDRIRARRAAEAKPEEGR